MQKRANNLNGYFSVREYNAKKERKDWNIKAEGATIEFQQVFTTEDLPADLSEFAKVFEKKDGTKACAVRFKIGSRCKWFGKNEEGKFVEQPKPANEELDGKRFKVAINYNTLHGDASLKEASGYWANGICIIEEASSSMFDDLNEPEPLQAVAQMQPMPAVPQEQPNEDKLPF